MGNNSKYISINIWDDFYDDGYIPKGKKQETYCYIEEDEDIVPIEKQKKYLEILYEYIIENLNIKGVKIWLNLHEPHRKYPNLLKNSGGIIYPDRWEIRFEGLTHKRLDSWMRMLGNSNIKVDDKQFYIYSES